MSKSREDLYIFCASLMRAAEKNLMPAPELVKMVEAATFDEAMAVAADYGYGDGKPLTNPREFSRILEGEEKRVYDFVFSALPDKSKLDFLKCPRDYHNVKAILKAEFLGIEADNYMASGGRFEAENLNEMIRDRNYVFLSVEMKDALSEASELFAKGRDPQEIDIILDKACYSEMLRSAEKSGSTFLVGYVRLLIDILNLITFVRLRQMGKPWTFFRKVFLEGGEVRDSLLVSCYEEPYQQMAEKLTPYGFGDIIEKGAVKVRDTGMYTLMEKLCDDRRIEYIKNARYISFGIEPAAAYLIAKESEIKNLRMILTGRIAGTENGTILERLRETYV